MPYKPKSIEDEGLETYLNRTAHEHNGIDFAMFDGMVKRGVTNINLRRAMGIRAYETMDKYLKLYRKHDDESTKA